MKEIESSVLARSGETPVDTTPTPLHEDGGRGRKPLRNLIPILLAVVAIGIAAKLFADSQANAASLPLPGAVTSPYKFTAGTPAPDFTLQSVDGAPVSLFDFRGKTVLVNFWATWCPPCRSEMPDMERVYNARKDEIVILAVNVQEGRVPVREFADKYGLTFPILMDTAGEVTQSFSVQSLPTSFFVDKEGRISSFNVGALNKSAIAKKLDLVPQ